MGSAREQVERQRRANGRGEGVHHQERHRGLVDPQVEESAGSSAHTLPDDRLYDIGPDVEDHEAESEHEADLQVDPDLGAVPEAERCEEDAGHRP
jgi:hypothetical protein